MSFVCVLSTGRSGADSCRHWVLDYPRGWVLDYPRGGVAAFIIHGAVSHDDDNAMTFVANSKN